MKLATRALGAAVVLSVAAAGVTVLNNPDLMKGFINAPAESNTNYDDGSEIVIIRLTWGDGQLALGHISVNGGDYIKKTLDSIKDKGGHAPTWKIRPNKGDKIEALVIPHLTSSGSSCSITDPKHPEAIKAPASTAALIGGSHCYYTVLG